MTSYLFSGQASELNRLQLQSLVWEQAGRSLLASLKDPRPRRVLDLGCGCLGWLRVLSEYVGPGGEVVGTDIDPALLAHGQRFLHDEDLRNVTLVQDDLFETRLAPGTFDLVHARFQAAPLGRAEEIVATLRSLVCPGGTVVLEEPDSGSWRFNPPAPSAEALVRLVVNAFRRSGGDFDAGRKGPDLLRAAGLEVTVRTQVLALEPGHPYLRLPLQFTDALASQMGTLVDPFEVERLRSAAAKELEDPARWGNTFTLVQSIGTARTRRDANS